MRIFVAGIMQGSQPSGLLRHHLLHNHLLHHQTYRHGRAVECIGPLEHNGRVRLCSHAVYPGARE